MFFQEFRRIAGTFLVVVIGFGTSVRATELTLQQVTFPERNQIEVTFARNSEAPEATLTADVDFREGTVAAD